jgi:hypothetical protein
MVATLAERANDPGQAAALGKTTGVAGATPVVVGQGDVAHQCEQVILSNLFKSSSIHPWSPSSYWRKKLAPPGEKTRVSTKFRNENLHHD